MTDLTLPIYNDENAAREHMERVRWPNGPVCPHCGCVENVHKLDPAKSPRPGLYYCRECLEQFTVTVGTVCERSHIPLHKWVLGFHLFSASKKGISAKQIQRMMGLSYKSAWFMCHRIREAMAPQAGTVEPMGGEGKIIEADETYYGAKDRTGKRQGPGGKAKIMALVERGGAVRSFRVKRVDAKTASELLTAHAKAGSQLMTDESGIYAGVGSWARGHFARHRSVIHSADEYVRHEKGLPPIHTNTIEGFFSIFKRGMVGVYQHCGEQHLQRYLAEFDFRYSNRERLGVNDDARALKALRGIEGKRLTYRRINKRPEV